MEEEDFYSILGVTRDADSIEIRRAFKRLALTHHPDKVVESERADAEVRFKVLSEAYETLVDDNLRAEYDAGLHSSQRWQDSYNFNGYARSGFYGAADDWFEDQSSSHTATGTPPSSNGRYKQSQYHSSDRTDDATIEVEVPLEDIYKGRLLKLSSTRQVICPQCAGTGARPNAKARSCGKCDGMGTTRKLRTIAPGVAAQTLVECSACHGTGSVYRRKDWCKRCSEASGTIEERSIIEVYIPKAANNNHRIVLEGKADEAPGKTTGDVVLLVTIEPHQTFRREGLDLYAGAQISLKEALTGFSRPLIQQLDGRQLQPTIPRGQVLKPGQILKLPGEGLVLDGDAARGDMYVQLDIVFPEADEIGESGLEQLASLLPSPHQQDSESQSEDVSHVVIEPNELPSYDEEHAYMDDDKFAQPPSCATM